jgi:hypothetical protein
MVSWAVINGQIRPFRSIVVFSLGIVRSALGGSRRTRQGVTILALLLAIGLATQARAVPAGDPWADVRSGTNGCAVAQGDSVTDDSAAIQCQIDFMIRTYGAGIVYFPCGNYLIGSTLTVSGGVILQGGGANCTVVRVATDLLAISFDSSASYAGLKDLTVLGYNNPSAGRHTVFVGDNALVNMRDCVLWGGVSGLFDEGIDGLIENCNIQGYQYGVVSNGANWYVRDKIDGPPVPVSSTSYAYYQGTPFPGATSEENHFVQCDFSGSWTYSVWIQDDPAGHQRATTVFESSVFSSPIVISSAAFTVFTANELGSSFTVGGSGGSVTLTGNVSVGGTLTISGSHVCAGNINISGC